MLTPFPLQDDSWNQDVMTGHRNRFLKVSFPLLMSLLLSAHKQSSRTEKHNSTRNPRRRPTVAPPPKTMIIPNTQEELEGMIEGMGSQVPSLKRPETETAGSSTGGIAFGPAVLDGDSLADRDQEEVKKLVLRVIQGMFSERPATFSCPEQWEVLLLCIQRRCDLLGLLRMGSGKTLIPVVCSMLESFTTIVILPLVALMTDYKFKLRLWKVPFHHWSAQTPNIPSDTRLILISADSANTGTWRDRRGVFHHGVRKILRTVWDEGGLALTQDFRHALATPYDLRWHPDMQVVVLSGSIPSRSVPALVSKFGLIDTPECVRTTSNRTNLKITLNVLTKTQDPVRYAKFFSRSKEFEAWFALGTGHAIFFVPEIAIGESLKDLTGWDFYHGQMTDVEKQSVYMKWRLNEDKKSHVLIASSSFGVGGDCGDVRFVVHVETPRAMGSFMQEINRGGRDGQLCECIMFCQSDMSWPPREKGALDHDGAKEIQVAIWKSKCCVRYAITVWVDGVGICCWDMEENEKCSRCSATVRDDPELRSFQIVPWTNVTKEGSSSQPGSVLGRRAIADRPDFASAHTDAKRRQVDRYSHMIEFNDRLLVALNALSDVCTSCLVFGVTRSRHPPMNCHQIIKPYNGPKKYVAWRNQIDYNLRLYTEPICFTCHLHSGEGTVHEGEFMVGCNPNFKDMLMPLAFASFHHGEVKPLAEKHFGRTWSSVEMFRAWLETRPTVHQKGPTNLIEFFLFVYETRIVHSM